MERSVAHEPRFGTKEQTRRATIGVAPLTWYDLLHRRRSIRVHVPYGEGMYDLDGTYGIEATPTGLHTVSFNT